MFLGNWLKEEDMYHGYQPIVHLQDNNVEGYEALLRSKSFKTAALISMAKKKKRLYELDTLSINIALKSFENKGFFKEDKLFLNVFQSTLLNPNFPSFIMSINQEIINNQKLVLEINEGEKIHDFTDICSVVSDLQSKGILIAINDFGKGTHGIKVVIELKPDYIKVDRYFTAGIEKSKEKQEVISFLVDYCEKNNTKLTLVGLENDIEVNLATSLGVAYGQGYHLSKPKGLDEIIQSQNHNHTTNNNVTIDKECIITFKELSNKKLIGLKNKNMEATITKINLTSAQISTSLDIPVQGKVKIELKFTYDNQDYLINGVATHKKAYNDDDLINYNIKFINLSPKMDQKLRKLINNIKLENKKQTIQHVKTL